MRVPAVLLLVLLALVAAGCGSSGSSDQTAAVDTVSTTDTTTDTSAADTTADTTTTDATTDTTADTTTTTDTTADASTVDTSTDVDTDAIAAAFGSKECQALFGLAGQFAAALGAAGSGDTDLEKAKKVFDEYAAKAPDEVKADFEVLANAIGEIGKVYADAGLKPGETPDADAIAKIQEASKELEKKLDTKKVEAASERISKWVDSNCKPKG